MPDGRTIVIAGLTRKNFIESKRKVPLLGDIPLLGWLFRWNTRESSPSISPLKSASAARKNTAKP